MITVTNNSAGPRGIHAAGEIAMLAPGESRELDVQAGDLKAAQRSGWFAFEGEPTAEEEPAPDAELDALSDDELRTWLKDHGVEADGRWQRKRLLVEAEKLKA